MKSYYCALYEQLQKEFAVKSLEQLPTRLQNKLQPEQRARFVSPMLATLIHEQFSSQDWIFERKFDGVRAIVVKNGDDVKIYSRNRNLISRSYPEIVEAFTQQSAESVCVDGEIVAFNGPKTSFAKLQNRMHVERPSAALLKKIPAYIYLFDLLHLQGKRLESLPLRMRRSLLKETLRFGGPLRFSTHRNKEGEKYFREACKKGWEGLIAKKADSIYEHRRSHSWLKFKCSTRQEFVVAGFTEPAGSRKGIGALLVGYYEEGKLRYAGKVGTGFSQRELTRLHRMLREEEISRPAYGEQPSAKNAHWTKPEYVVEIAFSEWTREGRLRHPRYLGLRHDKNPKEVVREDRIS